MMHGVLEFLTSNHPDADSLRSKYIFKIMPMLNPDGVINGNYRCSLVGADLNRRWKNPHADIHPIIHQFKKVIKSTAESYEIDLICDLHGHSRKQNIFVYGCNYQKSPQTCKLFPYILSKISPTFSYEDSRFGVQKSKESTLRVSLFKELKIPNIFTLEASFCGGSIGKYSNMHYSGQILAEMGRDLCRALLILNQNPALAKNPLLRKPAVDQNKNKKTKEKNLCKEELDTHAFIIHEHNLESILNELLAKKESLHNGEGNASSSGSESEPSEDNLDFKELKDLIPAPNTEFNFKKYGVNRSFDLSRNKRNLRKCSRCNEDEVQGHVCRGMDAPSPRRKAVGIKTYYNIAGKRVHDQATQTPPSFYEKSPKKVYLTNSLEGTTEGVEGSRRSSACEPGYFSENNTGKAQYFPSLRVNRRASASNSSAYLENSKRLQPINNLASCRFSPHISL